MSRLERQGPKELTFSHIWLLLKSRLRLTEDAGRNELTEYKRPWQNLDYQSRAGLLSSRAVGGWGGGELPLICYKRHSDVPCSTHGDCNYILPRSKPCHWGQRDVSVDKSRIALSEEPGLVSNTYMADHGHMQLQFEGSSTLCWTPQALGA